MRSGGDGSEPFEQWRFEDLPERPRLPHPYFEAQTEHVTVDSAPFGPLATHVVSYGPREAPPLLLIHGLMTTSYSWRYMFERLGDRYRLVVPDLPGAGRSAVPAADRPIDVSTIATFIGELQSTLGIDGCPAVGNSLGGLFGIRAALDDPSRFERLVVIHAPAVIEPRLVALHVGLRIPGAQAILRRIVRRDPLRWAHKNIHYYDETLKSLEEAHEYGDPLASAAGARAFTRYLDGGLDPRAFRALDRDLERLRDSGAGFPVPLQLVYSREQDPTVPPRIGPKLHALVPDADFEQLARTSHFIQVDQPDRLAALLREFLERPD